MSKKRKRRTTYVGLFGILVIFIVVMAKQDPLFASSRESYRASDQVKDESFLDRARSVTKRDGKVNIVVLGSSVTLGLGATDAQPVWGTLLENHLNQLEGIQTQVINMGYSGYSTADLLAKNKISHVLKAKPDIIIFELCLINNNRYPQNSIEQTKADISSIMQTFQDKLPNTLVLLQSANPTIYNDVILADGKVTYDQYNKEVTRFVRANDWNYIDIYELMNERIEQNDAKVERLLNDHVHPNGDGYRLWYDLLEERLDKPLRTLR
ncbi:SGNH/GDSL hydrolase family protein [Pisciglobus halotolerans]|uniref:Lysophospholipase L1 n=1 Tax=Pisciglobus halotolerans TaxID=745365 RepID=A0A1I3AYJ3_9LACT|nr:SGNH/GDSL hydrolase family protein [Pisciglobus halotolerans]SFH54451.1 Lysophospholipase L1 [Pisciglobus halotolerans]